MAEGSGCATASPEDSHLYPDRIGWDCPEFRNTHKAAVGFHQEHQGKQLALETHKAYSNRQRGLLIQFLYNS